MQECNAVEMQRTPIRMQHKKCAMPCNAAGTGCPCELRQVEAKTNPNYG